MSSSGGLVSVEVSTALVNFLEGEVWHEDVSFLSFFFFFFLDFFFLTHLEELAREPFGSLVLLLLVLLLDAQEVHSGGSPPLDTRAVPLVEMLDPS